MLKTDLVTYEKKDIFTTSKIVAEKLEVPHKDLLRTIEKIIKRKENLGGQGSTSKFEQKFIKTQFEHWKTKIKFPWYLINEPWFSKLIMNLSWYKKAEDIQNEFIYAFFQMKEVISNQTNNSWLQKRTETKQVRSEEMDIVKEFVEYAKQQWSQSAERYYANITKMTNKALELLIQVEWWKPIRDLASVTQLWFISSLDDRASKSIENWMKQWLHYKEIYIYAKEEVNQLANALDFKPRLK